MTDSPEINTIIELLIKQRLVHVARLSAHKLGFEWISDG